MPFEVVAVAPRPPKPPQLSIIRWRCISPIKVSINILYTTMVRWFV